MQKAVRYGARAKAHKVAVRDALKQKAEHKEWRTYRDELNERKKLDVKYAREERISRRKEWIAGPLAPMYDAGLERDRYGSVDIAASVLPSFPKIKSVPQPLLAESLVAGDRVAVINGPDRLKGLIKQVMSVDLATNSVRLVSGNMVRPSR